MRKVLVSIAALGAALSAAPSMAQSWGNPGGGYGQPGYGQYGYGQPGYNNDYRRDDYRRASLSPYQIRDLVEQAIREGRVDRREARDLRDDVKDLIRVDRKVQRYGYNWANRREIDQRSQDILRRLRDNGPGYGRGWGGANGPRGDYPQGNRYNY